MLWSAIANALHTLSSAMDIAVMSFGVNTASPKNGIMLAIGGAPFPLQAGAR
jgi:hypothetical protein